MFKYLTIQYHSEQKLFSETFQPYCQCSIDNSYMQLAESRLVYWQENCRQQLYINTCDLEVKKKIINLWKKASLSMKVKVSQSCPTLWDSMDYWSGQQFPSPGYLPNPGIEPRSPSLLVDSLPSQPPRKTQIMCKLLKMFLNTLIKICEIFISAPYIFLFQYTRN